MQLAGPVHSTGASSASRGELFSVASRPCPSLPLGHVLRPSASRHATRAPALAGPLLFHPHVCGKAAGARVGDAWHGVLCDGVRWLRKLRVGRSRRSLFGECAGCRRRRLRDLHGSVPRNAAPRRGADRLGSVHDSEIHRREDSCSVAASPGNRSHRARLPRGSHARAPARPSRLNPGHSAKPPNSIAPAPRITPLGSLCAVPMRARACPRRARSA